jgi:hypothetical protein
LKRDGSVGALFRVDLNVADNSYAMCSTHGLGNAGLLRHTFDFVGPDTE